ncbi:ABC transporter ATP-binding protein [Pontibacillus halophilus JSM 076056 = DSM 19796]|uniref:ABC transporter ATP-binding protein n=1 Tax=Pontibacillus halophilus JSM 076056 = DSM 19796 TaxID=1385510 RepID=A0A0A5I916_9BACI|nr:ATP-binding cassette domain-containing protein [Pontibacillus halophilus]KGX92332.1 ABC transporter ATP-binding protein [Pontibacillus halophilus JSM 076056 = DSM 19796]
MEDIVLSVKGLGKSFKENRIVEELSFDVKKGEIMAILGPNGAGKSTTIRNIMGILRPDEGTITYHGYDSIPKHRIGYLPEERGLYKNVKLMDIFLYFADLKEYPRKKARARALEYLQKLGLEGKENTKVEELSKGMAQKAQFIVSIIHEPDLLILDEPFSGLDPVSQDLIMNEIRELANEGTAILLSAHQMNLVEKLVDELYLIHKGKRVIQGGMNEVKEEYANYKCTIKGENKATKFEEIPFVQRVEQQYDYTVLHLGKEVVPAQWIHHLPSDIIMEELSIDRISLHEIFVAIATEKELMPVGGDLDA